MLGCSRYAQQRDDYFPHSAESGCHLERRREVDNRHYGSLSGPAAHPRLSYRPCVGLERRINRHALLPLGLTLRLAIFPVYPLNGIDRQVSSYSLPYGCEEGLLAEAAEHPEALQLVLDRILHFSKTQLDAGGV